MAVPTCRVVITGIGVFSPIGSDPTTYWQSLIEGRSGVRKRYAESTALPSHLGADIPDFDPKKWIIDRESRKNLTRMMSRTVQLGLCAAQTAVADAAIPKDVLDPTRFGVEFGAAMIHSELDDVVRAAKDSTNGQPTVVNLKVWGEVGIPSINPLWMLKYLPNMPACHTAIMHNIQGPSNTITMGEVSSLHALAEARRLLERDLADVVLVGGADNKLNPLNFARHTLFQPLTRNDADPAKALRPFDRDRSGTVLGEGAAAFMLEKLEFAEKRGAKIYAEVVGFASGFDRAKDGKVLAKVLGKALKEAGITPQDVDHINAHGLGTIPSDQWEANGIRAVFGDQTPVWCIKGNVGSLGPAGSVIEMLGSILALQHGELPPTLNCDNPDPACGIRMHHREKRHVTKSHFVKISMTDLGQVGAMVIRRV